MNGLKLQEGQIVADSCEAAEIQICKGKPTTEGLQYSFNKETASVINQAFIIGKQIGNNRYSAE